MSGSTSPNISSVTKSNTDQNSSKDEKSDTKKMGRLTWTDQTEELLVGWADVSACYKWLHEASFRKYNKKNYYFAVPIIVLSTVAGTLSVSISGYVPESFVSYAQAGIGAVNIFTGVLTTLQSLFKYAQLSESHSNVSIGWSKLQRNIAIALSVDRESRGDADSFIKICRSEYDRLIEQSPSIPEDVIEDFKQVYQKQQQRKLEEKKKKHKAASTGSIHIEEDLILPDICDAIHHTKVYRIDDSLEDNNISIFNDGEKNSTDLFKQKISILENKISGVNQWKTMMMSERLAPLIQENNVLSHNKEIDIIHPPHRYSAPSLPIIKNDNNIKLDFQKHINNPPPLNHLRSIIAGHNPQRKNSFFVNKENFIHHNNQFNFNQVPEKPEVPKGTVKNLINMFGETNRKPSFSLNNSNLSNNTSDLDLGSSTNKNKNIEETELSDIKIDKISNLTIRKDSIAIPGTIDTDTEISINKDSDTFSENSFIEKTPIATPRLSLDNENENEIKMIVIDN
jgi:hypothetical protein